MNQVTFNVIIVIYDYKFEIDKSQVGYVKITLIVIITIRYFFEITKCIKKKIISIMTGNIFR